MKNSSIKRDIYLYLFGIVVSLIGIYTLMVNQSYTIGLYEATRYGFLYEIDKIEKDYLDDGELEEYSLGKTFQVFTDFNQIPQEYVYSFDWLSFKEDEIYESYISATPERAAQYLYAVYHVVEGSNTAIYIVSEYDQAIYEKVLEQNPPQPLNQMNTVIAGLLILLVFFIIRYLIHRLTKPVLDLAKWAENLDIDNRPERVKLKYRELELLSDTLVTSVQKQKELIEREEFFLRAASHELRTPIAVISASSELLERSSSELPKSNQRAIGRIGRSIHSMQRLMHTLLWLAREQQEMQDLTDISLADTCNLVVEEHLYLSKDKDIEINVSETEEGALLKRQNDSLVQIVLMNLVRNAIQHTDSGEINIEASASSVVISNPSESSGAKQEHDLYKTSFGVGLFLVEKICKKQGWNFEFKQRNDVIVAKVLF
ncbi:sensor histidine kinase [Vibrio sp. HN007]|uniref:sensor histidine kinase n=1 Tax=Vibrio iocasae TaxID=3098914 RepID=UPI0035D4E3AC